MTIESRQLRLLAVAGIAIVLIVALAAALLAFQASAAVERIAAALKPRYELTYVSPRVGLDGNLSVRNFRLRPSGEGMATLVADRAVLRPPGAAWFLGTAFGSGALPPIDQLGLVLEGASLEGGGEIHPSLRWIGARSAAPFEAAGCAPGIRFGAEDWQQVGLRTEPALLEADYAVTGPGLGTVTVAYAIPGSSRIEHRRVLKLADPRQPLAATPADAATVESKWRVLDDGFVAARNRMCGRRAQIARNLFADQHVTAVQAWFRRIGLAPSKELVDTYRRYALRGGELRFESRPRSPIGFASYAAADPLDRARALGATLQASGKAPVRVELSEATRVAEPAPVAGIDEGSLAAADAAQATPAAPPVDTGAPAPGTVPAAPATDSAAPTVAVDGATTPPEPTSKSPPVVAGSTEAPAIAPAPDSPSPASPGSAKPPAATSAPPAPAVASVPPPPREDPAAPPPSSGAAPSRDAAAIASTKSPPPASAEPTPPAPKPAAPKPAVTAKPAPPRAAPVRRGVADYATLERAVGMRLAVRTVHNTRRVGVLREWTGAGLTVELTDRDDGMNLKIPKGDIVAAEILDTNAVAPRAHAEKN